MSVQFFKGVGGSEKAMYNGSTGASFTGFAVKWAGKITVPVAIASGARRSQVVEGNSQGTTLVEAIDNATDCMQTILNMSKGYLTMFTIQCGLYRKDIEGTPVEPRSLQYGSVKAVNWKNASGVDVSVEKQKSVTLFVPFIKDDVSDLDMAAAIQQLCTDGKLCALNFHDDTNSSFDVTPLTYGGFYTKKRYQQRELDMLSSNDVSAGGADGVLRKRPITNP